MKSIISLSAAAAMILSGCATTSWNEGLAKAGFTPYYQPTGDARNVQDWKKYGPGSVVWVKSKTGQDEPYYWATYVIGEAGVQAAMAPENSSRVALPIVSKTVKGWEFDGKGGWTLDAVNKIAAEIGVKSDTTVELKFGNIYKASPMDQGSLHAQLAKAGRNMDLPARTALAGGRLTCVQNVLWTDSIRYTFKKSLSGSGSATYKLSAEEIAKLEAKNMHVDKEGGIEVTTPTFIAFTALPGAAADVKPGGQ